jgi:hypothetical protein
MATDVPACGGMNTGCLLLAQRIQVATDYTDEHR